MLVAKLELNLWERALAWLPTLFKKSTTVNRLNSATVLLNDLMRYSSRLLLRKNSLGDLHLPNAPLDQLCNHCKALTFALRRRTSNCNWCFIITHAAPFMKMRL